MNSNGREPIDMEIEELVKKSTDINKKLAKSHKINIILSIVMGMSTLVFMYRSYQFYKAEHEFHKGINSGIEAYNEMKQLSEKLSQKLDEFDKALKHEQQGEKRDELLPH